MSEKRWIVVYFRRAPTEAGLVADRDYLQRAGELVSKGRELGARLIAWDALSLALAFSSSKLERAVRFAAQEAARSTEATPLWTAAMSAGSLDILDGVARLAWGMPLVTAAALARVAPAGLAVVDPQIIALADGKLALHQYVQRRASGKESRVRYLDADEPWRPSDAEGDGGARDTEVSIQPYAPSALGGGSDAGSLAAVSASPTTQATPDTTRTDPGAIATRTRSALLTGQVDELERSASELLDAGASANLASRLRALASLQRGGIQGALSELADARRKADSGTDAERCQASLTQAVALAYAGRAHAAMLAGLDALARARAASDPRAIQASEAFMRRLFDAAERSAAGDSASE